MSSSTMNNYAVSTEVGGIKLKICNRQTEWFEISEVVKRYLLCYAKNRTLEDYKVHATITIILSFLHQIILCLVWVPLLYQVGLYVWVPRYLKYIFGKKNKTCF